MVEFTQTKRKKRDVPYGAYIMLPVKKRKIKKTLNLVSNINAIKISKYQERVQDPILFSIYNGRKIKVQNRNL